MTRAKYAIIYITGGLVFLALGWKRVVWRWVGIWAGASWITVGLAYARLLGPKIFGKQSGGGMAILNMGFFLPCLACAWGLWLARLDHGGEPISDEISPGLWLGRRCSAQELPAGVDAVLDMTSEFPELSAVTQGREYRCIPNLDATLSGKREFAEAVAQVVSWWHWEKRCVYVHCAVGHGRSAAVVIAALVASGRAESIAEAEGIVRRARPKIKLTEDQYGVLERWADLSGLSPTFPEREGTLYQAEIAVSSLFER